MARPDGRGAADLRPLTLERHASPYAEGSCLVRMGGTLVMCTASVETGVPGWRRGSGLGWVTAEYAMLPRATTERTQRERTGPGGRTHEIQRLIGRSVRASLAGFDFGEHTIRLDCDVLQADGGTRTAAITGAYVAVMLAMHKLQSKGTLKECPLKSGVAAISVGVFDGVPLLDLCYEEDAKAAVDMNVVMTDEGHFVEVQGTGEDAPFTQRQMSAMLKLAREGIADLLAIQKKALH